MEVPTRARAGEPIGDVAATEPRVAPARGTPRDRLADAFAYCFKVWLIARVGLAILAVTGVALLPANEVADVPGWPAPPLEPGWQNIVTAWERWDALWFLRIASEGYAQGDFSAAFFPLYPLLTGGLSILLGGHPLAAALLISNLAFLAALVVVYLLTTAELDEKTARRTVVYMAVFPTAFFFFAPYSESLFLLLTATSFFGARRGKWWVAGLAGALASATRSVGLTLVPALAIEAVRQARAEPAGSRRYLHAATGLAWSAFASFGALAYLAYWRSVSGNWFTPLSDQGGWSRELSPVWSTLVNGTREALKYIGSYSGGYHLLDWLIVIVVLGAAVWVAFRAPVTYSVYIGLSLLLPLSLVFGGRPLMSLPRFAAVMFPLFWALARLAERYEAHDAIVAVSASLLGVMTVLFVNWYFIF